MFLTTLHPPSPPIHPGEWFHSDLKDMTLPVVFIKDQYKVNCCLSYSWMYLANESFKDVYNTNETNLLSPMWPFNSLHFLHSVGQPRSHVFQHKHRIFVKSDDLNNSSKLFTRWWGNMLMYLHFSVILPHRKRTSSLTRWPFGDVTVTLILKVWSTNTCCGLSSWTLLLKLLSDEYHKHLYDKSALVQVMAWCSQTSCGVARLQWVMEVKNPLTLHYHAMTGH